MNKWINKIKIKGKVFLLIKQRKRQSIEDYHLDKLI